MNKNSSTNDGAASTPRKLRVLLVDDAEVARRVVARLLASYPGVRVVGEGSDGYEGLALATRFKPDLVITDLQMPGLDGFQLVGVLRQKYPAMHLIITSAQDTLAIRDSSLQAGADDFIAKERLMHVLPGVLAKFCPDTSQPAHPNARHEL